MSPLRNARYDSRCAYSFAQRHPGCPPAHSAPPAARSIIREIRGKDDPPPPLSPRPPALQRRVLFLLAPGAEVLLLAKTQVDQAVVLPIFGALSPEDDHQEQAESHTERPPPRQPVMQQGRKPSRGPQYTARFGSAAVLAGCGRAAAARWQARAGPGSHGSGETRSRCPSSLPPASASTLRLLSLTPAPPARGVRQMRFKRPNWSLHRVCGEVPSSCPPALPHQDLPARPPDQPAHDSQMTAPLWTRVHPCEIR